MGRNWGLDKPCPRNAERIGVSVPMEYFRPAVRSVLKLIIQQLLDLAGGKKREVTLTGKLNTPSDKSTHPLLFLFSFNASYSQLSVIHRAMGEFIDDFSHTKKIPPTFVSSEK